MWLRLQARKFHAQPPGRRPFPEPFRKTFLLLRGCSRSHTCCASEHLAVRAFGEIHLRCGCAGRRGNFTPDLPAEGYSPNLSEGPPFVSAAAAAATPAAFPIPSPHELPVRFTSDVAAPAGAEISRPTSPPKAIPRTFPKDLPSCPRLPPQPHLRRFRSPRRTNFQ